MFILKQPIHQKSTSLNKATTLGNGAFATVYGPFSKIRIIQLLQSMFTNNSYWKSVRKTVSDLLNSSDTYIIRFESMQTTFANFVSVNTETSNIIREIPIHARSYFITILIVGYSNSEIFEIQRYGGKMLSSLLVKSDMWIFTPEYLKRFWTPARIRQSLISWYHLFEACLFVLEDKEKLFTDIKPQNMVIDDTGKICMIDIERISVPRKEDQRIVFTMNPSLIPIQFINPVTFFDNYSEYLMLYLDKRTLYSQKKKTYRL